MHYHACHCPTPQYSTATERPIGICNAAGEIPYTRPTDYPVTIRHIGLQRKILQKPGADTIFMQENTINYLK